ncbi:hypothetical protein ACWD04_31655 [Streptomyces sp. NPDC002911]
MSQQSPPVATAPPSSDTAAAPARIRRAVELPGGRDGDVRTAVAGPCFSTSEAPAPAPACAPETPATAAVGADRSTRNRIGSRLMSLAPRRPGPSGEAAASSEERDGPETIGAGQGAAATRERTAVRQPPSRGAHKPVLVAAAVVGAVLAAVPFVAQKGSVANYEGQGQSTPVATFAPDGGGPAVPNGHASSMPLHDVDEQYGSSTVPQPEPQRPAGDRPAADRPAAEEPAHPGAEKGRGKEGGSGTEGPEEEKASSDGPRRAIPAFTAGVFTAEQDRPEESRKNTVSPARATARTEPVGAGKSAGTPAVLRKATEKTSPTSTPPKSVTAPKTTLKAPVVAKPISAPATPKPAEQAVASTRVIRVGQPIASGGAGLSMEADGNFVVRDRTGVVRWAANTATLGDRAVFQADGNLVVVAADGRTVWSSGTAGNPGARLVIQETGRVLIRSAGGSVLWSAGARG